MSNFFQNISKQERVERERTKEIKKATRLKTAIEMNKLKVLLQSGSASRREREQYILLLAKNRPAEPLPIFRAKNGDANYFKRTPVEDWESVTTEYGNSVLYVSIENNHLHCTKLIYARSPFLLGHQSWLFKATSLHLAALQDTKPTLTKFLISVAKKEHFRMRDDSDHTPMDLAIIKGNIEAVKLMMEAYPNFLNHSIVDALVLNFGKSDDHISVKTRRLILEKNPNVCKIRSGNYSWAPVHYAASVGDLCAIEDIIRFCPKSVHMVDEFKRDFLDIASASGHSEMVIEILQRQDLNLGNNVIERREELCIPRKYLGLYKRLVNKYGDIVSPSTCPISKYVTVGQFLAYLSEIIWVTPERVSQEMISEWEKLASEYGAFGLQVSWFQELVAQYREWLPRREQIVRVFKENIVTQETEIATRNEAMKILEEELEKLSEEVERHKNYLKYQFSFDNPFHGLK